MNQRYEDLFNKLADPKSTENDEKAAAFAILGIVLDDIGRIADALELANKLEKNKQRHEGIWEYD